MIKKQTTKRTSGLHAHVGKRVKLALVPHKANHFRPHAIRRGGIALIVAIVVVLQLGYNFLANSNVLGTEAQVTTSELLNATNKERERQGQAALRISPELNKAAQLKAKNMFAAQYWAHNAPDGTTPWHWFGLAGYSYSEAGENLAKNFTTSDAIVAAWMASPTHRANILKSAYQDVGFAVMDGELQGKSTSIVVALYGKPEAASVQGATISTQAPIGSSWNPLTQFAVGQLSLSPAAIASLVVLLFAALLAVIAHLYRRQLPSHLRRSWYRHHGIYKAIGFTAFAIVTVFLYSGSGQI